MCENKEQCTYSGGIAETLRAFAVSGRITINTEERWQMCQTGELEIYEGKPFGNIMMRSDMAEISRWGIRPGDSVDVYFSSGAKLEDIPFLSGCILPEGMVCVNAHEGFDWVRIEKRFGRLWELCGVSEGETGRIVLRGKQKYSLLQKTFSAEFSFSREDYPSDEHFANYRELCGGKVQKGRFYRSVAFSDASVFDRRKQCLDRLVGRDGIRFILNMNRDEEQVRAEFKSGMLLCPCTQKLFDEGNIFARAFPADFAGRAFQTVLAEALRELMKHKGPYLIQCRAGLDRTGFLCCLLEALAGADESEIISDYMRSYEFLCGVTEENAPEQYSLLCRYQAGRALGILTGSGGSDADLSAAAEKYLRQCGLSAQEIAGLKRLLTD